MKSELLPRLDISSTYISLIFAGDIEPWIIWGYYSSPMMYGQNAIVINEFLDDRWNQV